MKNFAMHRTMITSLNFNWNKLLLVAAFMFAFFQISYSQVPGKKETIGFINKKFAGKCILELNGTTIIAKYYSEQGKEIRQDKVSSGALDTTIIYDPIEKMLSIPCLGVEGECVTRNLYIQKIKRQYARISFVVNDDDQADALKKALKHLIRLLSEPKYYEEISLD